MQLNIQQISAVTRALNAFIAQLPNEKNLTMLEVSENLDSLIHSYQTEVEKLIAQHNIVVEGDKIVSGDEKAFAADMTKELSKNYETFEPFLTMDEFKMVCPVGVDIATLKLLKKVMVTKD